MRRGDIGPFTQANSVDGADCLRSYLAGDTGEVVARMRVAGGNTPAHALECARTFEAHPGLIAATAHIYVPTDEQWAAWDAMEQDDPTFDSATALAEIDPGYAR